MKIISAIIENYKCIHRVEIMPSGNITVISGNNASGKSSAIEAIVSTLAGKNKETTVPVRKGENGAIIELDLGDFKVVRHIGSDGRDELSVFDKNGFVSKKPRHRLDELVDKRKFNVMTFITGTSKEQRALLLDLAGISFGEIDAKKSDIYNERTLVGRERDSLKGQLDGLSEISDAPVKLVDTQAIINEIKSNNDYNSGAKSAQMTVDSYNSRIGVLDMDIRQLEDKLRATKFELDSLKTKRDDIEKKVIDFQVKDNISLENQLKGAEETNNKFRQAQKRKEVLNLFTSKNEEYESKTEEYESTEKEKIEMLKNAKFPIAGLSVTDDGVIYNNLPLEQESHSNRIKVALSIAMAMPSELRTVIIDDGEVLDDDNMKVIDDWAIKNEYQVIIARRSDPADNVITIKEGKI